MKLHLNQQAPSSRRGGSVLASILGLAPVLALSLAALLAFVPAVVGISQELGGLLKATASEVLTALEPGAVMNYHMGSIPSRPSY